MQMDLDNAILIPKKIVYVQAGLDPLSSAQIIEQSLNHFGERFNYSVVVANLAFRALEYLEEMDTDIAIIQIDLPLLNAREMLTVLRYGGVRIPVYLLVSIENIQSISQSMQNGFAGVVPFPYGTRQLLQILESEQHTTAIAPEILNEPTPQHADLLTVQIDFPQVTTGLDTEDTSIGVGTQDQFSFLHMNTEVEALVPSLSQDEIDTTQDEMNNIVSSSGGCASRKRKNN
jgi:DNA-binding response OmpR family regulator